MVETQYDRKKDLTNLKHNLDNESFIKRPILWWYIVKFWTGTNFLPNATFYYHQMYNYFVSEKKKASEQDLHREKDK